MRKLLCVITALCAFNVGQSRASENRDKPVSLKGLSDEETTAYIAGLADGISGYQVSLLMAAKPPLFCPPDKTKTISPAELRALLNANLTGDFEDRGVLQAAAILELQRKYPCGSK